MTTTPHCHDLAHRCAANLRVRQHYYYIYFPLCVNLPLYQTLFARRANKVRRFNLDRVCLRDIIGSCLGSMYVHDARN